MTDTSAMKSGCILPRPGLTMDEAGAHLIERVGMEAERFGAAMQDGADAARVASRTCGISFMDGCFRMIRVSMRGGLEANDHAFALLQARTVSDACRLNVEFVRRQMFSLQGRLFELAGLRDAAMDGAAGPDGRA